MTKFTTFLFSLLCCFPSSNVLLTKKGNRQGSPDTLSRDESNVLATDNNIPNNRPTNNAADTSTKRIKVAHPMLL